MPIINQNLDISQQKDSVQMAVTNCVNAQVFKIGIVERSVNITDCRVAMNGVSGSPNLMLGVFRFTALSGAMSFIIGSTFPVTTYATSGYLQYSLPTTGSSFLSLQKGDILVATQGGGSSAASTATIVDVVVQNIQDVRTWY